MAISQPKKRHREAMRISFGRLKLHGTEQDTRMTIPKNLNSTDFPNQTGEEVDVILVQEEDEQPYLEVHPIADGE